MAETMTLVFRSWHRRSVWIFPEQRLQHCAPQAANRMWETLRWESLLQWGCVLNKKHHAPPIFPIVFRQTKRLFVCKEYKAFFSFDLAKQLQGQRCLLPIWAPNLDWVPCFNWLAPTSMTWQICFLQITEVSWHTQDTSLQAWKR